MENKNFAYLLILVGAIMFLLSLVILRVGQPERGLNKATAGVTGFVLEASDVNNRILLIH